MSAASSAIGYAASCLLAALAVGAWFHADGPIRDNHRRGALLGIAAGLTLTASFLSTELPAPAGSGTPGSSARTVRMLTTAYCQPGRTAAGTWTAWGTIAADLPLGTRVRVPGYGSGVVLDRGPNVGPGRLDLYIPDCGLARSWGSRMEDVEIVK